MGKQPDKFRDSMEIEKLKLHLNKQDEILEQQNETLKEQEHNLKILKGLVDEVLDLLKGSFAMDSKGMIANVREMREAMGQITSDIAHLQRFKKMLQDSKGTMTIKFSVLFTHILAVVGGLGTIVAIALGIKELIQK